MLEYYFSYRGVLKRLRNGALGAEMDHIAGTFSRSLTSKHPLSFI